MIASLCYSSEGYGFGWTLESVLSLDARDRAIYAEILNEMRQADAEAIRASQRGSGG